MFVRELLGELLEEAKYARSRGRSAVRGTTVSSVREPWPLLCRRARAPVRKVVP